MTAILARRSVHLALPTLARLFVVPMLAQIRENACFLDLLLETLERALKVLVFLNDDF